MAAPIRFLSGRQQQQKIGIEGSTDNQKVLEVVGQVGIGTTVFEPSVQLEVRGDASVSGVLTAGSLNVTGSSSVPATLTVESLNATGVSTFGGAVDVNAGLDVDGQSDLDEVVVAGVATFSNAVDINSTLDVDGDTQLDDLNVAGVSTFSSAVNATAAVNATDIIKGYKYTAVPYGSTVTLAVTVASKDSTHRYNGTGSGNGYVIDGIQAPFLTLTPGRTYRFTNDNTGSHPLKFYLEADKTTLYETNVNFQDAYTEITVTDQTPIVLHYQCTAHGYMGNAVQTNANVVNTNYPATIRSTLDVTGVSTFPQLDVSTGGLDVDGLTNLDEVIVAGVSTFTGNIVAVSAEFSGNVTIAGTLTAEDKTNIDSLGIVTARTGVRVDAGGLIVTAGVSTFTDSVDINNGVGVVGGLTADSLTISGVTTGINAAGISSFVRIDVDGQADLDELVVAGVATFQGAVNFDVNSEVNIGTGVTILGDNLHVTGIISAAQFIGDGSGITNLPGISTLGSSNLTDVNVSGTTTTVQLRISGVGTAEKFFVSTGGLEVDGQSDLDELVVAGVSTFSANTFINADLSVTGDIGASGIITATGINLVAGSGLDVGAVGVLTALSVDVSTGGIDVDGQATLDEVVVAGVATFSALADVNNRLDVAGGANIDQLNVAGIASFTQLDVSTGGIDVDGQATLDEVVVSGASTFTGTVKIDGALDIGVAGVDVEGLTNLDELIVAGVSTFSSDISIADKIIHTGDTNTAIRFPAADTFTVETAGNERTRVDSSGRLLINTTTSRIVEDHVGNGPQGLIQIEATDSAAIMSIISAGTADANRCGTISLGRHRNGTVGGTPTIVQDGDALGAVIFSAGDGTDMRTAGAKIFAEVDGTPGGNDMPGALILATTSDGAANATERLRITSAGNFNFLGNLVNVNATGVSSFVQLDVSTGGLDVDGQTDLDELQVAGVSTFSANAIFNNRVAVGTDATPNFSLDAQDTIQIRKNAGNNLAILQFDAHSTKLEYNGSTGNLHFYTNSSSRGYWGYGGGLNITSGGLNVTNGGVDISTGGLDVDGQTDLDELQVAGVSTFSAKAIFNTAYPSIDADNEIQVGTAIQLGKAGVITATSFSGDGSALTGIAATDHVSTFDLVVAGISTFNDAVTITKASNALNVNVLTTNPALNIQRDGSTKGSLTPENGEFRVQTSGSEDLALQVNSSGGTTGEIFLKSSSRKILKATHNGGVAVSGILTATAINVVAGSGEDAGNTGVVTAVAFHGDGSALTGVGTAHVSTFDLVVAGISTFNKQVKILNSGLDIAGVATFSNIATNPATGAVSNIYAHTEGGATSGTLVLSGKQDLRFNTGGFNRWILDGGDLVTHGTTYNNLGASSDSGGRVGNGYFQTSVDLIDDGELRLGTGDDLKLYHDGTNSHITNATGDLKVTSNVLGVSGIITATGINVVAGSGLHAGATGIVTAVGAEFNGTSHIKLPAGSTGQRPGSPTAGDLRYNSDDGAFEGYTDSWGAIGGGTPEVDTNVSSTSAVGVGSFATASFRSAEVVAQIVQIDEYQVGKYLMIHDGTTVTVIEQAAVSTGDAMIGSFDGAINGSNAELRVTMVSSGIATVTTKISTVTV